MDASLWSDDAIWGASSDDDAAVLEAALGLIDETVTVDDTETSLLPPLFAEDENDSTAPSSADSEDGRGSLEVRVRIGRSPAVAPLPAPAAERSENTKLTRRRGRPSTTATVGGAGTTAPLRRNRTKDAIEQLRPLARALESQLAVLQLRRELDATRGLLPEKEKEKARARREAWRAMAERQLAQRRRVESERRRLRDTLEEQTVMLRKLQRIFSHHQNRLRAGMYSGLTLATPVSVLRSAVSGDATDVLQSLTLALGQMQIHTDAVLADARFVTPGSSLVQVKTENEPISGTLAVQLMDARLVPFSMARTVKAVWTNLLHRANQERTEDPLAIDMVQSQFLTFVPGFDGHVEASMALRRVTERDRVVMVRSSVFTYRREGDEKSGTNKAAAGPNAPMTLHHFLWTAASRPSDSNRVDECQIQTCFISVPNLGDGDSAKKAAITQLCADVSKYFNADAHDEVDNLLLCGSNSREAP